MDREKIWAMVHEKSSYHTLYIDNRFRISKEIRRVVYVSYSSKYANTLVLIISMS